MDADLVLEGGGVKGIGLVGAYSALCDADYTFHRIAGSSAGAIVGAHAEAFYVASSISSREMSALTSRQPVPLEAPAGRVVGSVVLLLEDKRTGGALAIGPLGEPGMTTGRPTVLAGFEAYA